MFCNVSENIQIGLILEVHKVLVIEKSILVCYSKDMRFSGAMLTPS